MKKKITIIIISAVVVLLIGAVLIFFTQIKELLGFDSEEKCCDSKSGGINVNETNYDPNSGYTAWDDDREGVYKPVIYLYPTEDNTKVDVTFESKEELTCTYPKYNDGWSVLADKDGTIHFGDKEYNYLYWEGMNKHSNFEAEYCIEGEKTSEFLEEKLEELGLTRKEINEFIVYWLPQMENNKYNLISFDNKDYCDKWQLDVNPIPDTMIRVNMKWKSSDVKVETKEIKIETPERKGFTLVEWGGSKLN